MNDIIHSDNGGTECPCPHGEKRKLTRDVPNFCIRNRTMRTIADIDSTRAATPKPKILNMKNITENSLKIHYIML